MCCCRAGRHVAAAQAGTARALATCGLVRDPQLPDLPTATEAGFPGFEAVQWLGLLAPAKTPMGIVATINSEVNKALRDPDLVAKPAQQGTTAASATSEELRTLIATGNQDLEGNRRARGVGAAITAHTNGSTSSATRRSCAIGSPIVEIRNVTRLQPLSLNRRRCSMQSRGEP